MTTRTLCALALLAPAAALAGPCPTSTTVAALDGSLTEAEAAYKSVDLDGFTLAMDSATLLLPCLGEPIDPALAAHFHRMRGLSQVISRKADQAARSFTAAKAAEPEFSWSEDLIPPGHVIRTTYDAADPGASKFAVPAPPEAGALHFDGVASEQRPDSRPTLFQWVDAEGAVQLTALVRPGTDLPEYPAKAVPVPVPDPVTPEPAPVSTETTITEPGGGSIALPAAVTGGAVALAAGSAVLFFGPTKGAYGTYEQMRADGAYAQADAHYDSKVVPPRTAAQVLAGAAVVGVGVGAYLWTQSVQIQPTMSGLNIKGRF